MKAKEIPIVKPMPKLMEMSMRFIGMELLTIALPQIGNLTKTNPALLALPTSLSKYSPLAGADFLCYFALHVLKEGP